MLIHADGTLLAAATAHKVVESDTACGGILHSLACLNPSPRSGTDNDPRTAEALAAYLRYITEECGFIQLDGLPAEGDIGSRRLKFENLFIPRSARIVGQDRGLAPWVGAPYL